MKATAEQVDEIFQDAALWRHRYQESELHEPILKHAGIDEEAFNQWIVYDVLDTLQSGIFGEPDSGMVALDARHLAALMSTHVRMAFETGYLYGKGEIE